MARPKDDGDARMRLVEAAGRGFRTGGFGGAGVDALAKGAGLTSGAF
jgi:AcrR family transcriptional regulator